MGQDSGGKQQRGVASMCRPLAHGVPNLDMLSHTIPVVCKDGLWPHSSLTFMTSFSDKSCVKLMGLQNVLITFLEFPSHDLISISLYDH